MWILYVEKKNSWVWITVGKIQCCKLHQFRQHFEKPLHKIDQTCKQLFAVWLGVQMYTLPVGVCECMPSVCVCETPCIYLCVPLCVYEIWIVTCKLNQSAPILLQGRTTMSCCNREMLWHFLPASIFWKSALKWLRSSKSPSKSYMNWLSVTNKGLLWCSNPDSNCSTNLTNKHLTMYKKEIPFWSRKT